MPDPEVINCPACRHLVRVPAEWLGRSVTCPECKAAFRAPVRDGDRLTDPVLLAPRGRGHLDVMLLLPAYGLLFVGFASLVVNGVLAVTLFTAPDGGRDWARQNVVPRFRSAGFKAADEDPDPEKADDRLAASLASVYRWASLGGTLAAALELAGGAAMARRRNYSLAHVGCVAAALNFPHFCCLPGAAFGVWGLLMLRTDEGRGHFS